MWWCVNGCDGFDGFDVCVWVVCGCVWYGCVVCMDFLM